jgi:catechol 2,3-dioxygenase-like lactoylglutathione lyase family enzyme
MILGIEHLAIAAKDPQRLADWYAEVLGFATIARNDQTPPTLLVAGPSGAVIEIMPDNGVDRTDHAWADPGIRHIALRVDDLDRERERLEALGIESARPGGEAMGGGRLWNFADPEGNVLQIVERPAGFRAA